MSNSIFFWSISILLFLASCQEKIKEHNYEQEIVNLSVQVIHAEINKSACPNYTLSRMCECPNASKCQCPDAWRTMADSIILHDAIQMNPFPEYLQIAGCVPLSVSVSHFENISFYKKQQINHFDTFDRMQQLKGIGYAFIDQIWQCDETYFARISFTIQKSYTSYELTFAKDNRGDLFLENLELVSYN